MKLETWGISDPFTVSEKTNNLESSSCSPHTLLFFLDDPLPRHIDQQAVRRLAVAVAVAVPGSRNAGALS
ncbi:hypothetical protein VTN02DRAFT_5656 [Thermoascus thermophilus]